MLPGVYITVKRSDDPDVSVTVPYSDKFGFTCTHSWFKPLEEFFNAAKGVVQTTAAAAGSVVPGAASVALGATELVTGGFRLFGVQLFNKSFMAKAWEKSEPIDLGVSLNFFFGMNDKWSGLEEVYKPIMKIMGSSVPKDSGGDGIIITSPGPTAINVFADFGVHVFRGIFKSVFDTAKVKSDLEKNIESNANVSGNTVNTMRRTWEIIVGYSTKGGSVEIPFYSLKNLVVTSSGFTLSPEVDTDGAPINGTLKLNFTSQTLILNTDFIKQPMYENQFVIATPTSLPASQSLYDEQPPR